MVRRVDAFRWPQEHEFQQCSLIHDHDLRWPLPYPDGTEQEDRHSFA